MFLTAPLRAPIFPDVPAPSRGRVDRHNGGSGAWPFGEDGWRCSAIHRSSSARRPKVLEVWPSIPEGCGRRSALGHRSGKRGRTTGARHGVRGERGERPRTGSAASLQTRAWVGGPTAFTPVLFLKLRSDRGEADGPGPTPHLAASRAGVPIRYAGPLRIAPLLWAGRPFRMSSRRMPVAALATLTSCHAGLESL